MKQALAALEAHAKTILRKLLDDFQPGALELVGFTFFGVTYDDKERELSNTTLTASVKFRDHALSAPPNFLNEERLSALAIATYLAGRLACIPENDKALKLLVLDDLLVSLDYSHRRPVLDLIGDLFKGWQIIFRDRLMTYWRGRCPLTGIADPALLRASHIVPWADCESDTQRLDVHNGLLLSALWDAAFDRGLTTFDDEGRPQFSSELSEVGRLELRWNAPITLTTHHRANLAWHRSHIWI